MFYGRSNTRQEVNLNTNFFTSYSETAQVTAGGWNQQLSVQLKPCIGQDANGIRQYAEDRSQTISTSITADNAICLIEGFEKEVVPALKGEKESGSASIIMGNADSRKILTIGYENGNSYLSIATGLNEIGVASQQIKHQFNKKSYLVDYIPTEGNAVENSVEVELINFMEKVKSVKDLSPIIPHSMKYYEMRRSGYSGNNNNNGSTFNQGTMPSPTNDYSAPITNSSNMDDFLPFN